MHGHRYAIEITLSGTILEAPGSPENGMVMDFSRIKQLAAQHVVEPWDHAFLVFKGDSQLVDFLASLPGHKTVLLETVPTAEHLAKLAYRTLQPVYQAEFGNTLRLERVRLYETPNCWADATASDLTEPR